MSIFEDVTLKWGEADRDGKRKEYKIPSNKIMMAIAAIEQHITLAELGSIISTKHMPVAKVACAYGALLRYAGCQVTDEEVYGDLFSKTNSGLDTGAMVGIVMGLLALMIPPSSFKATAEEVEAAKKKEGEEEADVHSG